ncbi:MAG TPA: carboxypeptidase-like regulatory domain-containing protein [Terriglobales bacterium]|nr:carboxypeptidase-like regulatory domain-containing protein [Terriglobales bacterium]
MRNGRACSVIVLVILSVFLLSEQSQAQTAEPQTTGANLSGTVKDAAGMAVPFAKISIKNQATGAASDTQTDASGVFRISNLALGGYEVTASAEGFAAQTTKVTITAGTPPSLNIALAPSSSGPSLSDLGFSPAQTQGSAAEQARLDKRSHMLKVHQRFGVITTVPLVATVLTGFAAGGKQTSSTDRDLHAALGSTTALLYGVTAYYAIFAPKILGTKTRGPIKAHKILAWIHGPGMVLTPILGAMAFSQKSKGERIHGIASLHGPVAVITAGAYGAAILSVSLKW